MIVWAAWLRVSFPGFETASGAIINSIGCLTAFVPQVRTIILSPPLMCGCSCSFCRVYRYVLPCLSIVARRMTARHVLLKNLATIETLGCMTVLCSDKTGTLTEGNMVGFNFDLPTGLQNKFLIFYLKSVLRTRTIDLPVKALSSESSLPTRTHLSSLQRHQIRRKHQSFRSRTNDQKRSN